MVEADVVYVDTEEGAALLDSASVKGHFWTICRYFVSEKFLTYCGIASSVTVLNSLGIEAPDEPQIYPYKMFTQDNIFTDEVLHHRRPLAAYHTDEDRFLLMDVARYKSPPCWVKASTLHNALQGTDTVSQKSRGFLVVSLPTSQAASLRL